MARKTTALALMAMASAAGAASSECFADSGLQRRYQSCTQEVELRFAAESGSASPNADQVCHLLSSLVEECTPVFADCYGDDKDGFK